jgi:hypothetical protein
MTNSDKRRTIEVFGQKSGDHFPLSHSKDGAPGEIRTPGLLVRSFGVRKSKCLIVRCLRAKVILKPVLSWATWATTNFDITYLVIRALLNTHDNRMEIEGGLYQASLLVRCHAP